MWFLAVAVSPKQTLMRSPFTKEAITPAVCTASW